MRQEHLQILNNWVYTIWTKMERSHKNRKEILKKEMNKEMTFG